ncbi:amidohydrolase family protein [Actinoplanes sp. NPDC051494]|uniref:amidohydrolase family protein n=1 Tax=Actinoplanes sp. NPDC051494 TaxID=3363907 RepID=UPI0037A02D6D
MTTWLLPDSLWWNGHLTAGLALPAPSSPLPSSAPGSTVPSAVPIADIPAGAQRLRLPGSVLPGLVDAHVHAALVDLPTLRAGGIAGAWDLGGPPTEIAAQAARNTVTLRYAGPFLIAPGGYPSDRSWVPPGSCREIRSPGDAACAVAEAQAAGATLIKVTANADGPTLPPATLTALVTAAHDAGLPVVVHAEGPGMVAAAHDAGADLLAHTPWTDNLDEGLIRACATRMTWISTLDIHGWGRDTPARHTAIGNLRRFLDHGGTVRYGTDLGNGPLPLAVNPRELRALQSAGMTPADILTSMTTFAPPSSAVAGPALTWLPAGLDLVVATFADSLATARVLGPEMRPRHIVGS